MTTAALYLIPVQLSDCDLDRVLPSLNLAVVAEIKHFIVENTRSARRFLKRCNRAIDIDSLTFNELNRHTAIEDIPSFLEPLSRGEAVGVISEAGCPAIADPGADVVAIAQRRGYTVKPLVGPSSILLGLMASGFNGQSFTFNGYLPIDEHDRKVKIDQMLWRIRHEDQTQIFIETPYRNRAMLDDLCRRLPGEMKLCVATDLTGENEKIATRSVARWSSMSHDIGKVPTIFLLYK